MKITVNIECDSLHEFQLIQDSIQAVTQSPAQTTTFEPATIAAPAPPPPAQERHNVSPGEPSIIKMGAETKRSMLAGVGSGAFGAGYNGKSIEYLRLLWKRGEVKFDGKEFYK